MSWQPPFFPLSMLKPITICSSNFMFDLAPRCTVKANSWHSIQTRQRCAARRLFSVPLHPTKYLASFSLLPASTSRRVLPSASFGRHYIASSFSIHSLLTAALGNSVLIIYHEHVAWKHFFMYQLNNVPIKCATSSIPAIFWDVTRCVFPLKM